MTTRTYSLEHHPTERGQPSDKDARQTKTLERDPTGTPDSDSSDHALGIDIGGTFTDLVLHDTKAGTSQSLKILTTHDDPARGVMDGIRTLLVDTAIPPASITRLVHATTLLTNALIERKGAKTGLITTKGFRDVLEIGRERKYDLYDIGIENPAPLVPRNLRREVAERLGPRGEIWQPLDLQGLRTEIEKLQHDGVESVAIVFLHAYANPAHEQAAATAIAAWAPALAITTSHDVAPEIREFERASTTVASAYVKPLAIRYIAGLQTQLAAIGITAPLLLMLSNGGLTHTAEVIRNPVQMLESGPAAGALAAAFFGGQDGHTRLLGFDMGGTTAKLSLVENGEPLIAYGFEAAREKRFMEGSGLPIRISTVELIEIGAGGGSIARADELGLLKVGPDSAGSEPGPACYARGGTQPTVTDANLLLGYLNPAFFAGGTMHIDPDAAAAAMATLAAALGLTREATASGIHTLVNETMAGAARVHIAEHGRDPRAYTLLLTGGGGPVHGCGVARLLGITRVLCPPSPGVASAWGLLVAPARVDRGRSIEWPVPNGDMAALEATFTALETEARIVIAGAGAANASVQRLADGRFVGQGFALTAPLPPGPYDETTRPALAAAFEAEYLRVFSRAPPGVALEFAAARVALRSPMHDGALAAPAAEPSAAPAVEPGLSPASEPHTATRPAWFPGGIVQTTVLNRNRLAPGDKFHGPALVEDPGSTLVIPPGATAEVTPTGSILIVLAKP